MADIQITPHGRVSIVRVEGRIVDGQPAERFQRSLRQLVNDKKSDTIFDFSKLTYFDSVGIGILLGHYVSVTRMGGKVLILGANDKVRKLMMMVRLDDRFGWADELEEALSWFGESP